MQNDNPDTISIEESQWIHTEVDDIFLPSVRVQLSWKDVEAAVEKGAVVPRQAHALWAAWAAPASGLRVGPDGVARAFESTLAETQPDQLPKDSGPGVLQRYGLLLGLVAGAVLGAGGTWLLLG